MLSPSTFLFRLRLPGLIAAGILVGGLTLGSAVAQQALPSDGGAAGALRPGSVHLVARNDVAPGLSELRFDEAVPPTPGADQLLAVGPDGTMAAVASQIGPDPASLVLVSASGTLDQLVMPGLIGAGFAPDSRWLAVIDGSGSIWHVSADGASAQRWIDGPFIGQPIVEADGSVIALHVSSIEAPIVSRLVRIGPDGTVSQLADDQLVYGAQLMADGSIAYAAHRGSRLVMMRLSHGKPAQVADLGEDAIHAQLSPNADAVAFERQGGVFLQPMDGGRAALVADGASPRFAPDGLSILVDEPDGSAVFSRAGVAMAGLASQAAFARCVEDCEQ